MYTLRMLMSARSLDSLTMSDDDYIPVIRLCTRTMIIPFMTSEKEPLSLL